MSNDESMKGQALVNALKDRDKWKARAEQAERERDELRIDGSRLIRNCNDANASAELAERAAAAMRGALSEVVEDGLATNMKRWQDKAAAALATDAGRDYVPRAELERVQAERDEWKAKAEAAPVCELCDTLGIAHESDEHKAESARLLTECQHWHGEADDWKAQAERYEKWIGLYRQNEATLAQQAAGLMRERDALRRRLGEAVEALHKVESISYDSTGTDIRIEVRRVSALAIDNSAPSPAPEPFADRDWFADVLDFHRKFGVSIEPTPCSPDTKIWRLRRTLIDEECNELLEAIDSDDATLIADGAADLIYVVLGTCISYGIDLRPIWAEVHRTNMAKVGGATREDGKILKPEGWTPPRIEWLLSEQKPLDAAPSPAPEPSPAPAPAAGARYWWNGLLLYRQQNGHLMCSRTDTPAKWDMSAIEEIRAPYPAVDWIEITATSDADAIAAAERMRNGGGK